MELGLIFGAGTAIMCLATFFAGRKATDRGYGERWGRLEKTLEVMQDDIKSLKTSLESYETTTRTAIERVYIRMDEKFADHLEKHHKEGMQNGC